MNDKKTQKLDSEKILQLVIKNKNAIVGSLIAVVVVLIGYGVMNNLRTEANKKAADAFYEIQKKYESMVELKKPTAPDEKVPEPKKLTAEQSDELLNVFRLAFEEHNGTPKAGFALIDMVFILKENNFTDEAIALSEEYLKDINTNSMAYAMALMQLGSLQMEKIDYKKAIETFSKVESLDSADFLKGEAMIKKGLCYQALNQIDQAKDVFSQASEKYPDSEYGESAKKYLRVLLINN